MNHQDALREMSVERYLLGELTGEPRDLFEEHLFDCAQCTADLKSGVTLLEGTRIDLVAPLTFRTPQRQASRKFQWLLSPAWMVPALAACMLLILYQFFVVVPGVRRELARAETPSILNNLVLAGGTSRGDASQHVQAPTHGSFLLSVDIPSSSSYVVYRCSLRSPSGSIVWHGEVAPEQAKDTVQIHIPVAVTQAGENTFLVQGVRQDDTLGAKLDNLMTYRFSLELHP